MSSATAPLSTPTRRRAVVRCAPFAAMLLTALVGPATSLGTAGAASAPDHVAGAVEPSARGLAPGTYRITLLTGDVVALHVTADRRQAAWVEEPVEPQRPPHIYEADGQVHAVPAEAAPYLDSGALDPNLFNLTLLARDGFDDATTGELPLLIEAAPRAPATAMPAAPDGTEAVLELDSVNTVSVAADKAHIRTTWEDVVGARQRPRRRGSRATARSG